MSIEDKKTRQREICHPNNDRFQVLGKFCYLFLCLRSNLGVIVLQHLLFKYEFPKYTDQFRNHELHARCFIRTTL